MQRTFTILKPDTVKAGNAGLVIDRLIKEGFRIRAMKMLHLTKRRPKGFTTFTRNGRSSAAW